MNESKLTIDLEKNDAENRADTTATRNPCLTCTQSFVQRFHQSITSKDNINLAYMTFNDDTLEKEFQLSIEERLLLMTKMLGVIIVIAQIFRVAALLFVGSTAFDGILVTRLSLVVLTLILPFLKFPKCLNLTPRRRATLLILLTYSNLTLVVLAHSRATIFASLYLAVNIMSVMLSFTSLSILLVVSPTALVIMNVASFYLLYSSISDQAVCQYDALSADKLIFITSFAIIVFLLLNTAVSR